MVQLKKICTMGEMDVDLQCLSKVVGELVCSSCTEQQRGGCRKRWGLDRSHIRKEAMM